MLFLVVAVWWLCDAAGCWLGCCVLCILCDVDRREAQRRGEEAWGVRFEYREKSFNTKIVFGILKNATIATALRVCIS